MANANSDSNANLDSNAKPSTTKPENIIFFDGVCSLCNGFIDFLIKRDSSRKFRYAPLQGQTANERLPMARIKTPGSSGPLFTSVVFLENGLMHTQSDAVLRILANLGGVWSLVSLLKIIPRFLRDYVYSVIATNRYRWFGQRDTCRIPSKEEQQLFYR